MKQKVAVCIAMICVVLGLAGCGGKAEKPSDTMRWINGTHAVLTAANRWNIDLYGGMEKTADNEKRAQQILDEWWSVTDRASADKNLNWLLDEGHRTDFNAMVQDLEFAQTPRDEFEAITDLMDPAAKVYFTVMYDAAEKYGIDAITAWDYSRAVQCLGQYYLAGYYTEQEALDKSLEICKTIQQTYDSWDAFYESYLYGYQYWSEDDIADPESDSYARKQMVEQVKAMENGPFQLDWKTELVKTW